MRRERWIALVVLLIGTAVSSAWVAWDFQTRQRVVNGPIVQMISPEGCTIVWEMHPPRPVALTLRATSEPARGLIVSPVGGLRYEAVLSGLSPDRVYSYQIGDSGRRGRIRTAPATSKPFRFLALGDTGDGEHPQWQVARLLPALAPDLIVHTGDLVYPVGDIAAYPKNFYRPYSAILPDVPFYPCLGNHDVRIGGGSALLDTFVLPRNGPEGLTPERNYWFDYGNVRFVAIDSNNKADTIGNTIAPWLERVLADARARWRVVFFHEPIYTHGKYDEAAKLRDTLVPVFDRQHVNLVLCGHNHMYERTHPLRGGQVVSPGEGTVYVTTGAGGAGLYKTRPRPPAYLAFWEHSQHSFTVIDVNEDVLHVRQAGEDGRYLDDFFVRRPKPATSPVASIAQ